MCKHSERKDIETNISKNIITRVYFFFQTLACKRNITRCNNERMKLKAQRKLCVGATIELIYRSTALLTLPRSEKATMFLSC